MRAAIVTASMSRKAGGLFFATRPLATALLDAGCEVDVFAGVDDFSQRDFPAWGDTDLHIRRVVGPASFGWQPGLAAALRTGAWDILHLHGLWMYSSLAVLRSSQSARCPRIVSPHGMLDPWALANSGWKKRIVSALYEGRNLHGATCLHALNEAEAIAFRDYGLRNPVAIVPNGVDLREADAVHPPPPWADQLPKGARALLFLGRIHPKKGLPGLIAAMGQIGSARLGPWHLVIAGWDQGGHECDLRTQAEVAGIAANVIFVGPQFGVDKASTLAHADAFILPSHSEGLPMAVLDAWAHRLPVLMTEACNLPEGTEAGAAVRISLEPEIMAVELRDFFALTRSEQQHIGDAGRGLVEERFDWRSIGRQMADVYSWCCDEGPKPDCIREYR